MKFDVVVGNPPYQIDSGTTARDDAIYHNFYNLSEKISDIYVLISPGRFLFNAGSTPKSWNKKMLEDNKLKILFYDSEAKNVFPSVNFSGGVVILYYNKFKNFNPIEFFTSFKELNTISMKIRDYQEKSLNEMICGRGIYRLTNVVHDQFPEVESMQSKGHKNDIGTGAFDKFNNFLFMEHVTNLEQYTKIYGRFNNSRSIRYILKEYINKPFSFDKWRVIIPKAYGGGITKVGLSSLLIGEPQIIEPFSAFTESFISIGNFDSKQEVNNLLKYIKTKFSRTLLGVLKITQDNTKEKWKYVPIQDFTENSDIDWTKSISEIDQQLYKKYGLDKNEIDFIEEKVRAME